MRNRTIEELRASLLHIKTTLITNIDRSITEPENIGFFQINAAVLIGALTSMERELRSRGFDPTSPEFGEDILGELIRIKIEQA